MNFRLTGPAIHLKGGMDYEAIIAQLQPLTKNVLCVEDGTFLRVFKESGPFPVCLEFMVKQKRWGMSEYYFRCDSETPQERVLCVFGRDNAETFCSDYVDDVDTDDEDVSFSSEKELSEELYTEIFTTSESSESIKSENFCGDESAEKNDKTYTNLSGKQPKINTFNVNPKQDDLTIKTFDL